MKEIILIEQHLVKPKLNKKDLFEELEKLCGLSKNLYNSTLYEVRQHFFKTNQYLSYAEVNKKFTLENQTDYRALPAKVAKHTQMLVERNFKSFFALLKNKKKHPEKYQDLKLNPKPPKYLEKDGKQVVHYEKDALSFKKLGYVKLSKTNIEVKTNIPKDKIRFVRVVPKFKGSAFVIEIGYRLELPNLKEKTGRYASIDIGLNNLATLTSNSPELKPVVYNGKPLKSINQFYNKEKRKHKSLSLSLFRCNKIKDYFHKVSKDIINRLVSNNIDTLIIGYNKNWKQEINLGKRNNQNFVQIPFLQFIEMLQYKGKLQGIEVVLQEESYTSKTSFLDREPIQKPTNNKYLGKRICRGLFQSSKNILINADVNGSLNILRKYLVSKEAWNEKLFSDCVAVCSSPPIKLKLKA